MLVQVKMLAAAALVAALGGTVHAQRLLGVDVLQDSLVVLNTRTGSVSVIGALGYDATNIELAWSGEDLFAVNSKGAQGADLLRIDPYTGAAFDVVPVSVTTGSKSSAGATAVEGLTADPLTGQLFASVRTASSAASWQAHGIGRLSASGVITDVVDFRSTNPSADFDALEMIRSGEFLASDGRPPTAVDLRRMTLVPTNNLLRSYTMSDTFGSINDFAWTGERLFGIDTSIGNIVELNPSTLQIVATRSYDAMYTIVGIAPIPAPAPATMLVGLAAIAARRRR